MAATRDKALYIYENGTLIPASPLDNILCYKNTETPVVWSLHSFFDGQAITEEKLPEFLTEARKNVADRKYTTTDHLFIHAKFGEDLRTRDRGTCPQLEDTVAYVSFDSSVRANINGAPLKARLVGLCHAIKKFITCCGGECIIFFSESCRSSFDGADIDKRVNEISNFYYCPLRSNPCIKASLFFVNQLA